MWALNAITPIGNHDAHGYKTWTRLQNSIWVWFNNVCTIVLRVSCLVSSGLWRPTWSADVFWWARISKQLESGGKKSTHKNVPSTQISRLVWLTLTINWPWMTWQLQVAGHRLVSNLRFLASARTRDTWSLMRGDDSSHVKSFCTSVWLLRRLMCTPEEEMFELDAVKNDTPQTEL